MLKNLFDIVQAIFAVIGFIAAVLGIIQYRILRQWKRKITWDKALRVARNLWDQIVAGMLDTGDEFKPDLVIGLGRSGGLWGGWLAGNLGSLPLVVVDIKYEKTAQGLQVSFPGGEEMLSLIRKQYGDDLHVLIVEGASSTGRTPLEFQSQFEEQLSGWTCKLAVLYQSVTSTANIDFVGERLEHWPGKFPWHDKESYKPYLRDLFVLSPGKRLALPAEVA